MHIASLTYSSYLTYRYTLGKEKEFRLVRAGNAYIATYKICKLHKIPVAKNLAFRMRHLVHCYSAENLASVLESYLTDSITDRIDLTPYTKCFIREMKEIKNGPDR